MGFEVMSKLTRTHDYSITYLFHLRVVFFRASKSLKMKYIGTWCDSFLPSFDVSLSCTRALRTTIYTAETYKMRG
jgi:hypothetical protein